MKVQIETNEYSPTQGLSLRWDSGAQITIQVINDEVVVKANRPGLVSMARHLLTLAQENVPPGEHLHLDESNSLEPGSSALVLERI